MSPASGPRDLDLPRGSTEGVTSLTVPDPQLQGASGVRRGWGGRSTAMDGRGITVLAIDDWGSQQDGRRKQEKRGKRDRDGQKYSDKGQGHRHTQRNKHREKGP